MSFGAYRRRKCRRKGRHAQIIMKFASTLLDKRVLLVRERGLVGYMGREGEGGRVTTYIHRSVQAIWYVLS
jgi:hypothetical protein